MKTTKMWISLVLISLSSCQNSTIFDGENQSISNKNPQIIGAETTDLIPLNDLGTSNFMVDGVNYQGGLYPFGQNSPSVSYKNKLKNFCLEVQPRDALGNINEVTGKIGFISIGASSCSMFMGKLIQLANAEPSKNPKLNLINCAKGGMDIIDITDPAFPAYNAYWNSVSSQLISKGMSANQVQLVYFEEEDLHNTTASFPTRPQNLKNQFKTALQLLKTKFPNIKICYFNSRTTTIYIPEAEPSDRHKEPRAYYNAWALKWLLEGQINEETGLNPDIDVPFLAWCFYSWSDGATPRTTDGFNWQADDTTDGVHPSESGKQKVAERMLNYFKTNSAAKLWFLD